MRLQDIVIKIKQMDEELKKASRGEDTERLDLLEERVKALEEALKKKGKGKKFNP